MSIIPATWQCPLAPQLGDVQRPCHTHWSQDCDGCRSRDSVMSVGLVTQQHPSVPRLGDVCWSCNLMSVSPPTWQRPSVPRLGDVCWSCDSAMYVGPATWQFPSVLRLCNVHRPRNLAMSNGPAMSIGPKTAMAVGPELDVCWSRKLAMSVNTTQQSPSVPQNGDVCQSHDLAMSVGPAT